MPTLDEIKKRFAREHIRIMQAYVDGKQIKVRDMRRGNSTDWQIVKYPSWNFTDFEYCVVEDEEA